MKKYKVTIENTMLNEERTINIKAGSPQDAHKEVLWEAALTCDEKIVEIRNDADVLVYGPQGFVNTYRDLEQA